MHERVNEWYGAPLSYAAGTAAGWTRLTVAAGAVEPRRSRAVVPAWAEEGVWEDALITPTAAEIGQTSRVFSSRTGGVEGIVNPHADTRGRVRVSGTGVNLHGVAPEAVGTLHVSRCRDGVRIDLPLESARAVYGLGEKTGGLNKIGRTWTMWNSDDPEHIPDKDPLYQSIPVAYLFDPDGTTTIFVDCTATVYYDVGESDPTRLIVEAYDACIDVYIRRDPSLPDAVRAYTELTGRMPIPPEWALGFQQCRYSYFPDTRVIEIAERMRHERVPCDVIYLDIHYMDQYRVFTWDSVRFPDPAAMIAKLHDLGFRVVTIVDPGVKADVGYGVYRSGLAAGHYLRQPDGSVYTGAVWPGDATYPDFTDADARDWWADSHTALFDPGVDGVWNDMNEPADFSGDPVFRPAFTVPDTLIARNDGTPVDLGRVHNAYGLCMNVATRAAFDRLRPQSRGFVLTRAGYAGIQRYAAVWTGDNHSWWEHIGMMVPMLLNLGISGVAFCGGDAGGFQANADAELFSRFVAAACLTPFFRAHTAIDTIDHEPWSFGDQTLAQIRGFIELRYRFLPYLYSLFEQATRTGAPVMRPLVWEFPDDPELIDRADSFLVGGSLLVAPVRERGVRERSVYLPDGLWYDLHTGTAIAGPTAIVAAAPLDRLPVFVRGGSIIVMESARQSTAFDGDGVLRLLVAPDREGRAAGELYCDAGEGHDHRDGSLWRARIEWSDGTLSVTTIDGDPAFARWKRVALHPIAGGVDGAPVAQADLQHRTELAG